MNSPFRRTALLAVLMSVAWVSACNRTEDPLAEAPAKQAPDPEQAEASIKEAQAARIAALNNRDVDGAVSVYAPNATLVIPNVQPLTDPASIRANYASLLGDDKVKISVTPTQTWVSAGADFAVTTAQISIVSTDPEQGTLVSSTNQSVWQRQADGTWKIVSEYSVALPSAKNTVTDVEGKADPAVDEKPVADRADTVPSS